MIFNDFLKKIDNNQDKNLDESVSVPMVYELCIITLIWPSVSERKLSQRAIWTRQWVQKIWIV